MSQRAYFCTFSSVWATPWDYDDGLHEYEGELPRYRGKQRQDDWDMNNPANYDVVVNLQL